MEMVRCGEDVTENLKTIKSIPKKLKEKVNIIVRGEVFIGTEDFEKMNAEQEVLEEKTFANARNAAARFFKTIKFQNSC